jgi:sugar O-acyltransferase (sialic acid O-acetyltransferase NeuD family)
MKHLIIVGAGGMGRCAFCIARESAGYGEDFDIKGFIDDNPQSLDGFENYPPLLSKIDDYRIEEDDVFVCSVGDPKAKRTICQKLKARGATFKSIISNKAYVSQNVEIGEGCIIAEFAMVCPDVVIGANTLILNFALIGHDCKIGKYCRIDTHCTMVGGTELEEAVLVHTSSVINHNVKVGEGAMVGACSFVIMNVKPGTTVFGNPARKIGG